MNRDVSINHPSYLNYVVECHEIRRRNFGVLKSRNLGRIFSYFKLSGKIHFKRQTGKFHSIVLLLNAPCGYKSRTHNNAPCYYSLFLVVLRIVFTLKFKIHDWNQSVVVNTRGHKKFSSKRNRLIFFFEKQSPYTLFIRNNKNLSI